MLRRIVETTHEQAFDGIESAQAYAREARSLFMRLGYDRIIRGIQRRGLTGRFLEVGAGPAVLTTMLARAVPQAHITAVELSPAMVAVAREEVDGAGLAGRIELVQGDATDAGLLDRLGRFDLVYATYALHHWEDAETVIGNLLRATADGGTLLIHDLRRVWWLYWVPSREGFFTSIRAAYTPEEARDLLDGIAPGRYEVRRGPFWQSMVVVT